MTDSERMYLSILLNKHDLIYKSKLKKDNFSTVESQSLFNAIKQCVADGIEPDLIVLRERYGLSATMLSDTYSVYITHANSNYYHNDILENYRKRELVKLNSYIPEMLGVSSSSLEAIAQIDAELQRILADNDMVEISRLGDGIKSYLDDVEELYKVNGNYGVLPGLKTGFDELDNSILGFVDEQLIFVCARPSQGKSALGSNFANYISMKHKAGWIDLETDRKSNINRFVALNGQIDSMKLARAQLTQTDFSRLMESTKTVFDRNVYTYNKPRMFLDEVKMIARRMVQFYKCEIIFIDYYQLIRHRDRKLPRHEQLEEISQELKELARQLKVPVVCLAQLNRENEKHGTTSKPDDNGVYSPVWAQPSQIKGSGSAEQDADVIIFIEHGYDEKKVLRNSFLHVAKARNGVKKIIEVKFIPQFLQFRELDKRNDY